MKHICHILRKYNTIGYCGILAGCSELKESLDKITYAYDEARKTLRYTMKNGFGRICCAYEDMGILRFLISDKNKEEVLNYCDRLLYELRALDEKDHSEYVKTLWTYLKMNNNLLQTSKALFIHRNTLLNRISKIESIIEKDIGNPYVKQEYMNAFSILEFYGLI